MMLQYWKGVQINYKFWDLASTNFSFFIKKKCTFKQKAQTYSMNMYVCTYIEKDRAREVPNGKWVFVKAEKLICFASLRASELIVLCEIIIIMNYYVISIDTKTLRRVLAFINSMNCMIYETSGSKHGCSVSQVSFYYFFFPDLIIDK